MEVLEADLLEGQKEGRLGHRLEDLEAALTEDLSVLMVALMGLADRMAREMESCFQFLP